MTELDRLSLLPPVPLTCYTDAADVPEDATGWVYRRKNPKMGCLYFVVQEERIEQP
jgi:hypothetical protein